MARLYKLRERGAIPERRHDAFLLALLIAAFLNFSAFAVQAALPRLAALLRLLSPRPSQQLEEARNQDYPFVLVDSSLVDDEEPPSEKAEAEANVARRASQAEATPELSEDKPFQPEGVEEILSFPVGNPGLANGPEENPQPESEPEPEPAPEPEPQIMPQADSQPESPPTPDPEPIPEPTPEAVSAPEPSPEPPPKSEPPPEEVDDSGLVSEIIDLAMLPEVRDAMPAPEISRLAETPNQRREPVEAVSVPPLRPETLERSESSPPAAPQPRREPTFRRIGDHAAAESAGGAPPRKNLTSGVKLLDASDPIMNLLAHRYGEYMAKMGRRLQESLNRQMILTPFNYTRGQIKVRFGVGADGSLTYQTTIFPVDGSLELERILAERTVREAAVFEPMTPNMLSDADCLDLFQNLTVLVNLY